MKTFEQFIPSEFVSALGWTLLHSLWQGALIAIVLGIILLFVQKNAARVRYMLAAIGLVLIFLTATTTFAIVYNSLSTESAIVSTISSDVLTLESYEISYISDTEHQSVFSAIMDYFNQHLPAIVLLWLLGLLMMSLRFLGSMAYLQRLKYTQNSPLSDFWQSKMQNLSEQLGIKKTIRLVESKAINVPMVIGYLKPVILLPVGVLSGLSTQQVEAVIAHELAHIRRHDYLINIIQSFIEMLFFFHPAVWWISNHIRTERENCCDDIALQLSGDNINFVKALTNLEAMKINPPQYAIAFTGQKNQLLNRVSRLLGKSVKPQNQLGEHFAAITVLILCLLVSTFSANANLNTPKEDLSNLSETTLDYEEEYTKIAATIPQIEENEEIVAIVETKKEKENVSTAVVEVEEVVDRNFPTIATLPNNFKANKLNFNMIASNIDLSSWTESVARKEREYILKGNKDINNAFFVGDNVWFDSYEGTFYKKQLQNLTALDSNIIDWDKKLEENDLIVIDGDRVIIIKDGKKNKKLLKIKGKNSDEIRVALRNAEEKLFESTEKLEIKLDENIDRMMIIFEELEAEHKIEEKKQQLKIEMEELKHKIKKVEKERSRDVDEVLRKAERQLEESEREIEAKMREMEQKRREREAEYRKKESERRVIEGRSREEAAKTRAEISDKQNKMYDKLKDEMIKDGILKKKSNKMDIRMKNNKITKINGQKISKELQEKYEGMLDLKGNGHIIYTW